MNANTDTANLINVSSAPAVISVNFDEVKAQLSEELAKYDVVVTQDTLKDAKSLATQLNKNASEFDKRRKDAVAQVSEPIKQFEAQMKELVTMCKNGRQKIVDQVKKFEDETKTKAKELLAGRLVDEWSKQGVEIEFRRAVITDLVKLTALTKAGKLTSTSIKEIESRVATDKCLQDQTEMRLLKLENESYKAGLAAPLTRAHVEAFLFAPEEDYQSRLGKVMESEIQREKKAEEAMRAKLQREENARNEAQKRGEDQKRGEEAHKQAQAESAPTAPAAPEQHFTPPTQTAKPVSEKHAYGLLSSPVDAIIEDCTFQQAVERASLLDESELLGIWVPGQLIAIIYNGEVFRKA